MMQVVLITTDNYITQTVAHNNLLKKSAPRPFEEAFGSRFFFLTIFVFALICWFIFQWIKFNFGRKHNAQKRSRCNLQIWIPFRFVRVQCESWLCEITRMICWHQDSCRFLQRLDCLCGVKNSFLTKKIILKVLPMSFGTQFSITHFLKNIFFCYLTQAVFYPFMMDLSLPTASPWPFHLWNSRCLSVLDIFYLFFLAWSHVDLGGKTFSFALFLL